MEELYRKYQGKTIKDDYGKNSKEFIDFANESFPFECDVDETQKNICFKTAGGYLS